MASTKTLDPAKLKNPHKLGKDHLKAIIKDLGRLEKLDKDIARKAIRYVVDGSDDDVLLKIRGLKDASATMYLEYNYANMNWGELEHAMDTRSKVFCPRTEFAPEAWLRLAEVYEAILHKKGRKINTPKDWPTSLAVGVSATFTSWQRIGYQSDNRKAMPVTKLEAIFTQAGVPLAALARGVLSEADQNNLRQSIPAFSYYGDHFFDCFTGWDKHFAAHLDVVREALNNQDANNRIHVLRSLNRAQFDYTPIIDLLADVGTSSSKTLREEALPILNQFKEQARTHVEKILAEGNATARHEAAQLLYRLYGNDAADVLRRHAESESAARVKQTIEKLLAAPTDFPGGEDEAVQLELPPVQVETGKVPLPKEAQDGLREYFERCYQQSMRQYEREMERWKSPDKPQWMHKPDKPPTVNDKVVTELIAFLENGGTWTDKQQQKLPWQWRQVSLGDALAHPDVKLIHIVRIAYAFGTLSIERNEGSGIWWWDRQELEAFRSRCQQKFGLRELDAVITAMPDGKPGMVADTWLSNNSRWNTFCDWEPEAVWPIFAEHPDTLRNVLSPPPRQSTGYYYRDYTWPEKRRNVFRVLAMFPKIPSEFIPLLWDIALGESKTDRPLAQQALASVPGKTEKVLIALGDGKQAIRSSAAEWLGKIGDPAAIEPLKEAFRKEKQEIVKGTIMSALDALGADVSEFLDRDKLLEEAQKGLKKIPKGMEWVPLDSLPSLHWQDTGEQVHPDILKWWVVQSIQQKLPVPGPIVRRYLSMCKRHETEALARFLLSAWIGHDTRTISQQEAAEKATKDADAQWKQWGKDTWFSDSYGGKKENLYRQLLNNYSNACIGSAIGQKGMLALVAAAGDRDCVKMCEQYIRKWFGNRLAQCKCLVEVLAWIEHPWAVQVLLSIANRFRTKALRQAAEEHVKALADREGWTLDELADRTIPDGGFTREADENGKPISDEATLVLDYGARQFTVKLDDELKPVVLREDGKTVKEPPAPAKNDDAELAKAAKKSFSEAKKTVKEVVKRQSERLYEALCTQRSWRFDDWQRYLAQHPIVGKLCCRVVWAAFEPQTSEVSETSEVCEKFLGCFRPLEDGSLTNEKDEEATFGPDAEVRVAHTCNVPAEIGEAWGQHLQDYDVEPLFPQFGRNVYVLPDDKKKETELNDFEGHLITTFKLRGKATKLGYLRGDAEDAGCFYLYRKPFPSLGLQAVIEFTGSYVPEEDLPAALTNMYFIPLKGDRESAYSWQPEKMQLSKIPPVLLSECYNDIKQIAADGSGYDPKWQEKSYF